MLDISILMCAHNAEPFIKEAIESILCEKDVNLELIIVNDRSTDGTASIIKEFALSDNRVKSITRVDKKENEQPEKNIIYAKSHGHSGLPESLNLGLKYCKGRYIARMDADDICFPHRFKQQLSYMEQHPEVDLVGSSAVRIDKDGKPFGQYCPQRYSHKEIVKKIRTFKIYLPHPTWFVRKELYQKLNGYDQYGYRAEDLDFILRASEIPETKFAFINEPLLYLRMHDSSLSYSPSTKPIEYAISAIVRHRLRMEGYKEVDKIRLDILQSVQKYIIKHRLNKKIISYNTLRSAYIQIKTGHKLKGMSSFISSFKLSPIIALNYKKLSNYKLKVAIYISNKYLNSNL